MFNFFQIDFLRYSRLYIASDAFLTIHADGYFLMNVTFQEWNRSKDTDFSSLSFFPKENLLIWAKLYKSGYPGILGHVTVKNIYTDQTWDCRRLPNGNWSKAVSYGLNNGTKNLWNTMVSEIDAASHWIWTNNISDTEIECRKILSGDMLMQWWLAQTFVVFDASPRNVLFESSSSTGQFCL